MLKSIRSLFAHPTPHHHVPITAAYEVWTGSIYELVAAPDSTGANPKPTNFSLKLVDIEAGYFGACGNRLATHQYAFAPLTFTLPADGSVVQALQRDIWRTDEPYRLSLRWLLVDGERDSIESFIVTNGMPGESIEVFPHFPPGAQHDVAA